MMNCSHIIVNCSLERLSDNVPPLWYFISKGVKHIKNGMRMWNMMKFFVSEVKRVAIDKF